MRMFLLFVLLLIPLPIMANTPLSVCSQYNNDQNLCNHTAGCYYEENLCARCPERNYCPSDKTDPQPCPPDTFPNSELGATSPEECFADITDGCTETDGSTNRDCGWFFPNSTPKCWNSNGEYITSYHKESNQCYHNILSCSVFDQSGCDDGEITGEALWNNGQWNIQGCKCIQEGAQYQSCIASIEKTPTTTNQPSAQDSITYNISYYFCTGCPAGGYVKPDTDFQTNSKCFASDSSILVVCQCTNVERGYYGAGVNDIEYPISNTSAYSQSPYRNACPAGKTTDEPGATSENNCKYSRDTKFCDAKGCFTLDNIDNWNFN